MAWCTISLLGISYQEIMNFKFPIAQMWQMIAVALNPSNWFLENKVQFPTPYLALELSITKKACASTQKALWMWPQLPRISDHYLSAWHHLHSNSSAVFSYTRFQVSKHSFLYKKKNQGKKASSSCTALNRRWILDNEIWYASSRKLMWWGKRWLNKRGSG